MSFVGAAVTADNRSLSVEVLIGNADRRLKPDMIARAVISQSSEREALILDGSLLVQLDAETYAVFIEKDGRAVRRTVTLGARNGSNNEILSGLSTGDRVIVSGSQALYDGQPVSVVESPAR